MYLRAKFIDRRAERLPIGEKLLRAAGDGLKRKLEALDEALMTEYLTVIAVPPLIGFVAVATTGKVNSGYSHVSGWALAILSVCAVRIFKALNERRRLKLGYIGEKAVGEELNQLMLDGVRVFHDVPNDPYGNIDHVLVAPTGVFAIEGQGGGASEVGDVI